MFRKSPGFAAVAVLALAFGIGVNAAIFTLLNAVALRPLPVKNPGEVVTVYQSMRGLRSRNIHGSKAYLSYPEYAAYRDRNHTLTGLAAFATEKLSVGGGGVRAATGQLTTCNYFSALSGAMTMGRGFLPEECASPGAGPVAVLSYAFWKRQYAGDPSVLGKTIVLNRHPFTIVGVGAEGFSGASILGADVWSPISMQQVYEPGREFLSEPNLSWLEVAGRLKPGIGLSEARADLAVVAAGLVMTAFHTAYEAGWLTVGQAQAFDLSWLVRPGTPVSSLLTGVLGIQPFPVWIEVIAWLAYLVPMLLLVTWPPPETKIDHQLVSPRPIENWFDTIPTTTRSGRS
jgi:hypothetical protein